MNENLFHPYYRFENEQGNIIIEEKASEGCYVITGKNKEDGAEISITSNTNQAFLLVDSIVKDGDMHAQGACLIISDEELYNTLIKTFGELKVFVLKHRLDIFEKITQVGFIVNDEPIEDDE